MNSRSRSQILRTYPRRVSIQKSRTRGVAPATSAQGAVAVTKPGKKTDKPANTAIQRFQIRAGMQMRRSRKESQQHEEKKKQEKGASREREKECEGEGGCRICREWTDNDEEEGRRQGKRTNVNKQEPQDSGAREGEEEEEGSEQEEHMIRGGMQ